MRKEAPRSSCPTPPSWPSWTLHLPRDTPVSPVIGKPPMRAQGRHHGTSQGRRETERDKNGYRGWQGLLSMFVIMKCSSIKLLVCAPLPLRFCGTPGKMFPCLPPHEEMGPDTPRPHEPHKPDGECGQGGWGCCGNSWMERMSLLAAADGGGKCVPLPGASRAPEERSRAAVELSSPG